jgi:hypothetical protein
VGPNAWGTNIFSFTSSSLSNVVSNNTISGTATNGILIDASSTAQAGIETNNVVASGATGTITNKVNDPSNNGATQMLNAVIVNQAAGSGSNCLQIDTLGNITKTGVACGSGGSGNATSLQSVPIDPTAPTSGQLLAYNGTSWIPTTTGGSVSFASVTAGTSGAHLVMGAGGSLTVTAGGTVQATSLSGNIPESQVTNLTTDLAGKVATTTTVNGHALSAPVVVSASDLTTGTLPHAALPTLLSGDIPANAANTTGTSAGLTGNPSIGVTNITIAGTCTGCPGSGSLPNATDTLDKLVVNNVGVASLLTPANDVDNIVVNNGIDNSGVTPVAAAIATILNGLPANQSPEVYLPAGLYKINAGILVNCTSSTCNGIHIRGAGRDNTVLQTDCSGNTYGLWFNNTTNSGDNWLGPTVEDLTIQDTSGTGACSDLLKLTQIAEANISRVKLMSAKGHTYATGTISTSGSTVTGSGTTFTSAMVPGVLQVAGKMVEVCTFTSSTSLGMCDTGFPTGNVSAGTSYALAYGGRGLTFDPGFSFTQYITVRDLFTYGDMFGVYSMGTNNGGNSRITFDGDASWNDGLRIPNSVAYFLGKHTDTFHIKTPANLVTRCWVLDSAHANEISGDCEYNSTYTVMTTCNGGVAAQSCNLGAEISADATSTGYGNAFTSPYVYLAGTAFQVDNTNGATNLSIAALRGASFANTNSYSFNGTTGCPLQSSGVQANIHDWDCVYSPLAPTVASYTIYDKHNLSRGWNLHGPNGRDRNRRSYDFDDLQPTEPHDDHLWRDGMGIGRLPAHSD